MAKRHTINITTDGAGAATVYGPKTSGRIESIHYIKDAGANPFANGVDFAFTVESTGEAILTLTDNNASSSHRPRTPTHIAAAGAAALYAAGGTGVNAHYVLGSDRVKLVIAQGGATKVGQVVIVME